MHYNIISLSLRLGKNSTEDKCMLVAYSVVGGNVTFEILNFKSACKIYSDNSNVHCHFYRRHWGRRTSYYIHPNNAKIS